MTLRQRRRQARVALATVLVFSALLSTLQLGFTVKDGFTSDASAESYEVNKGAHMHTPHTEIHQHSANKAHDHLSHGDNHNVSIKASRAGVIAIKESKQLPKKNQPAFSNEEMIKRTLHMREMCMLRQTELFGITDTKTVLNRIQVNTQWNYLYCPILKVGSTFWQRALYSLRLKNEVTSPYKITIKSALHSKIDGLTGLLPFHSLPSREFLSQVTSFLFVREPLVRLLSGYMDKFFAPNPYFWKTLGRTIILKFRPNASEYETKWGHNVTFSEFIRYTTDTELHVMDPLISRTRDLHFSPAYDQCKVCALNYTLLGKMESFSDDVSIVLQQLGVDVTPEMSANWSLESKLDAIMDSVNSPFGWKREICKTMSWFEGLRRVWRKLQSRALIALEDGFPFSEDDTKTVTAKAFINVAKNAHERADKERLKRQRIEVLVQAYSTVDLKDIHVLLDVFQPDFQLFGYDERPSWLFDKKLSEDVKRLPNIFAWDNL